MKISEMLYDAAKYPFSGVKQLLLLGLMLLIISLLLGQNDEFYIILQNILGDNGLLIVLLPFLIISAVFILIEAGYSFKVIEESILRVNTPPKFNNFTHMIKHGINEIFIAFIYFIVPFIILLVILDDAFSQINLGLPQISDELTIFIIIAAFLIGFVADIIFTVAIPHMASKGGAFREAFRFSEIFHKIKQIGFKKLFLSYIIVILGIVIIGGPILKEIVGSANIYGFFISEELIAPYLIMFASRFTALIYMESL